MRFFDLPFPYQLNFQDPASPIMEGIIDLHHSLFFFLLLIFFMVLYLFSFLLRRFCFVWLFPKKDFIMDQQKHYFLLNGLHHSTILELIWTILPSCILLFIAVPSFSLLYSMDEVIDPMITIKVIGHQWYWSYECGDAKKPFSFDSYMIPEAELVTGETRLLEVDHKLVLPSEVHVRLLVTSADVLHSFAIPSMGIKVDAVPGRLNQLSLYAKRNGLFFGQCSELCGVNHGFMPICLRVVPLGLFDPVPYPCPLSPEQVLALLERQRVLQKMAIYPYLVRLRA